MKIKDGFMLREIAGIYVVVPFGERIIDFNGLMTLNHCGVLIWKQLEKACTLHDLIQTVTKEYSIDELTAENDINSFLEKLSSYNVVDFSK